MKIKKIIYALVLCGMCLTVPATTFGQGPAELTKAENDRIDSLKMSYDAQELKADKIEADEKNLSNLKAERSDTRKKAKEAKRIEREANDAARESRTAYRTEKKAQDARKQADKQAKKAAKARKISDDN